MGLSLGDFLCSSSKGKTRKAFKATSRNIPTKKTWKSACTFSWETNRQVKLVLMWDRRGWLIFPSTSRGQQNSTEPFSVSAHITKLAKKQDASKSTTATSLQFRQWSSGSSHHIRESKDSPQLTPPPTKLKGSWITHAYEWLLILIQR